VETGAKGLPDPRAVSAGPRSDRAAESRQVSLRRLAPPRAWGRRRGL